MRESGGKNQDGSEAETFLTSVAAVHQLEKAKNVETSWCGTSTMTFAWFWGENSPENQRECKKKSKSMRKAVTRPFLTIQCRVSGKCKKPGRLNRIHFRVRMKFDPWLSEKISPFPLCVYRPSPMYATVQSINISQIRNFGKTENREKPIKFVSALVSDHKFSMDYMDLYTCRTCLSRERRENVKSIISDRLAIHTYSVKISIIEAFHEITRLVLDENEQITHYICLNCVRRLRQAMLFRMTAVKSYERLATMGPDEDYPNLQSPATDVVPKMEITDDEYLETQFLEDEDDEPEVKLEDNAEVKVEYVYKPPPPPPIMQKRKKRKVPAAYHKSATARGEKQIFVCDFCHTELQNKRSIFLHMKKYHMSKKPYKCWIEGCGRLYVSPAQRRFHQEAIHFKIKPYVCDFCGLCFTDNAKLQSHRRVHTGERPYKVRFLILQGLP